MQAKSRDSALGCELPARCLMHHNWITLAEHLPWRTNTWVACMVLIAPSPLGMSTPHLEKTAPDGQDFLAPSTSSHLRYAEGCS
jgi:hypothetical protein